MSLMNPIEQTQDNNGQGSKAGTAIMQKDQTSIHPSPNSSYNPAINQDSFSFKNIHSLRFLLQATFSTIILMFCLCQLYIGKGEGKSDTIYWGGVTAILAWWMPSPSTSGTLPTNQPNFENGSASDPH